MSRVNESQENGFSVDLLELVLAIASTVDLISPDVHNHHVRVAFIALELGRMDGLSSEEASDLVLAAALHDIGALTLRERLATFSFEIEEPHTHAELGYRLLAHFPPFERIASIVRRHHVDWEDGKGQTFQGEKVLTASHIIHLADRVDVLIGRTDSLLMDVEEVLDRIRPLIGRRFIPDLATALERILRREAFRLDLSSTKLDRLLLLHTPGTRRQLDTQGMIGLTRMLSLLIDFQSRFTATHSSGVAAVAERLAQLSGYSASKALHFRIAGYLHDLGKIAVPEEILEKPSTLDTRQQALMRSHSYYTLRLLEQIEGFGELGKWAAYHHEKLDGTGYPFHVTHEELCPEARLMAVADIFTALTEDRPYREGMSPLQALSTMRKLVEKGALDLKAVELAASNSRELDRVREHAQAEALEMYTTFREGIE
ncbi:HD domain-containing protein [bacterium]|nr:HD domain-containing protein [bacterium]